MVGSCYFVRHNALGRADNSYAESVQDLREFVYVRIDTETGLTHSLETGNDLLSLRTVLERSEERRVGKECRL